MIPMVHHHLENHSPIHLNKIKKKKCSQILIFKLWVELNVKKLQNALYYYTKSISISTVRSIFSVRNVNLGWIFKIFQISFVVFEAGPDFLKSCARYNIDLRKALPKLFQGLTYASKKIC